MEYKTNNEAQNNSYKMKIKDTSIEIPGTQSALEKITNSYTKMPDIISEKYNIDKCDCENCGCIDKTNWVLMLSPAGIAGSTSASGPISAF